MAPIQSLDEFHRNVHEVIDRIGGSIKRSEDPIKYKIDVQNYIISILDQGMEGIAMSISNLNGDVIAKTVPVYNWSDAYALASLLVRKTASGFFDQFEGNTMEINSLAALKKEVPDFEWIPSDRFLDYSDELVGTAIDLVKCGAIKSISLKNTDNQDNLVVISATRSVCAPIDLGVFDREARRGIFPSPGFKGNYAATNTFTLSTFQYGKIATTCEIVGDNCKRDICLLSLCGYFEYLYRKGELYDFIQQRKNYRTPCGEFNYTWKIEEGLKRISDPMFYTAMALVENGRVSASTELIDGYNVGFSVRLNTDNNAGGAHISEVIDDLYKPCSQPRKFNTGIDATFSEDYGDAFYLVYTVAAYIDYLKRTGQEEQIYADRRIYEEENCRLEKRFERNYNFEVKTDSYYDVTEDEWNIACKLQKQGLVGWNIHTSDPENGETSSAIIKTYELIYNLSDELKNLESQVLSGKDIRAQQPGAWLYTITLNGGSFIDIEDIFKREQWPKVIGLAAYIDYIDMLGLVKEHEDALKEKWERDRVALQEALKQIDDDLVDKVVTNKDCNSLYCVIEGEDGTGRKDRAIAIAKGLLEAEKIDHFEPVDDVMTIEMASYKLQHMTFPHENDISEVTAKKKNGELETYEDFRSTLFLGQMKYYDRELVAEKVGFKKRRIYILTDIRDFLPQCESAKVGDNSRVSHIIEILGKYNKDTYIILVDEKKYIDHLFSLFPQIKYMFGSTIIAIDSLTEDEIFAIYRDNLQAELRDRIDGDDQYAGAFRDFCARNKKNFAVKNRELAEFLANFSNIHHDPSRMFETMEIYSSKSTDELLEGVIGMDNVKNKVREFKQYAIYRKYADNKGMSIPNSNMHMMFTGNPGTGKTMIARIIGQILYDAGIIEENKVIEVEGKDLKGRYIGESGPKTAAKIDEAIGGVLFVDEAYAIGDDQFGKEVVATLIKSMEDRKDKFVVIFAGYPKEMQEFMNINSGINSRIGYKFHFNDYSEKELLEIFNNKMSRAGYEYSDKEEVENRVLKLCKVFTKKKDFGNGRFIDKVIQQTVIRRATRDYSTEDVNIISPEDIPAEEQILSTDVVEHVPYLKQLDGIIGMQNVKKKIEEFAKYVKFIKEVEDLNPQAKIPDSNMHMIFTGNPGTGKTTIARIMVDLLYDVGIIKERKYIEVERKDLVGEFIGKTAIKTGEVIERALNGVLFIDEAYSLAPGDTNGDFGAEAVATLIKAMEDHKGDLIVIFAGYRDEMRRFEKINPGISSRIGYRFDFEDYSCSELVNMFTNCVTKAGFTIDADARKRVETVMDYYRRKQNFGNGRFVSRLWQNTLTKHALNYSESMEKPELQEGILSEAVVTSAGASVTEDSTQNILSQTSNREINNIDGLGKETIAAAGSFKQSVIADEELSDVYQESDQIIDKSENSNTSDIMRITEKDIPSIAEMNNSSLKKSNNASLEGLIGLGAVKAQMEVFERWVKFSVDAKEKGLKIPATSLHMIFSGNPGTGKTTVARIVAQKLYDLGVIMENKVVEADRSKLVSNHVGDTALKTHDVIESAMGGVLFIDEAYMLAEEGSAYNFGAEAVNTLMKEMEDKKDDFVVIFAGYKKEMSDFLRINPGIESRIGYTFDFEDYTAEELLAIFDKKMKDYGFTLDDEANEAAFKVFKYFSHVPNFGNGRFVDKIISQTLMNQAKSYTFDTMNYIGAEDIPTLEDMSKTMSNNERFIMPNTLSKEDKQRIATHEIGHAVVHSALIPEEPIIKVTIEPEGTGNMGYVEYANSGSPVRTKSAFLNEITSALAGLEAEKVFYSEPSAGGTADLAKAKDIAARMINDLGMGENSFGIGDNDLMSSMEINSIIEECREKAHQIIENNKAKVTELVEALMEKECLSGEEVMSMFNK